MSGDWLVEIEQTTGTTTHADPRMAAAEATYRQAKHDLQAMHGERENWSVTLIRPDGTVHWSARGGPDSDRYRYVVSAPIVALASVEVLAASEEEARIEGWQVLQDGDTNSSITVTHDFDMDREELQVERVDVDPARAIAVHVATEHFDMDESEVTDTLATSHERWRLMHKSLHEFTPCTHTHTEEP